MKLRIAATGIGLALVIIGVAWVNLKAGTIVAGLILAFTGLFIEVPDETD